MLEPLLISNVPVTVKVHIFDQFGEYATAVLEAVLLVE